MRTPANSGAFPASNAGGFAMSRRLIVAAAAGWLALAGAPGAVHADDDDGWFGWGGMMRGWGGPMMGYDRSDYMLERIDGRLAFLKTELNITAEQTPAWEALATAVHEGAEAHNALMRGMIDSLDEDKFRNMSMPDRLTFQETHLQARLDQVRSVKAAATALYTLLSDDQKKVADEIGIPTMGMGGGGFGMMLR
jgi:hypothetical protein